MRAALICLFVAGCARTPVAREVVEAHIEAQGGRKQLDALKTVLREGKLTALGPLGAQTGPYRTCVRYPDAGFVAIDAGPVRVREKIGPDGVYVCKSSFEECEPAPADRAEELRRTAQEANRELTYELSRWKGDGAVAQENGTWIVRAEEDGSGPVEYRFSRETKLLERKTRGARTRIFKDWRHADGILLPFVLEDWEGGKPVLRVELENARVWTGPEAPTCESLIGR